MRNWFWLRSSHPFSLFTILQPTFSSTSQNSLVSAPFCTLCSLPLAAYTECEGLLLVHKAAEGATPYTVPPGHGPPHQLCHGRLLNSLFLAAPWSLLHFQLLSLLALQHWNDLPTAVRTAEVPPALLE